MNPATFNRVLFFRFTQWLSLQEGINDNTITTHAWVLKGFLEHCLPDKNWDFVKFKEIYYDVIYLEENEIQVLKNATDLQYFMDKTRDVFLIACYTGVRYSDLFQIKFSNIKDGIFHIRQTKTKTNAYPPFMDNLARLLDKYDGACPDISNQNLNIYLKATFKYLNPDRLITINKRYKGSVERSALPLCDVITMHVARKTFIMTLLSKGIHVNDVM